MHWLRRSGGRHHVLRGGQQYWRTFSTHALPGPLADGFGSLRRLDELLVPSGRTTRRHEPAEAQMVTYVCEGALSQVDDAGNSTVIHAGEFQVMSTARRVRHTETSVSSSASAHVFRLDILPGEVGLASSRRQLHFTAAQRRNVLCVVASPDERQGSLRIRQDICVSSGVLQSGHHFAHELAPRRSAWLHIVSGEANFQDVILTRGDGLGVANEPAISFTALQENTEVLLVDLGPLPRAPWGN